MEPAAESRQHTLLGVIHFAPGDAILARKLRDSLENTHGTYLTMDALRAELIRLEDVGAVHVKTDMVCLTEFGRDAFFGRVKLPGWR